MSETKAEPTNQEFGQQYYGRLDAAAQDLSATLHGLREGGAAPETIDQATVELSKLRKDFTDAVPYLPSYDQRNLDLKIKSIESDLEGVRTASAPKAKFAFKRKAAKPTASPPVSSPLLSTAPPMSATLASMPHTSGLSISGHSHKYISLASLSSPWCSASELAISDLDHCVVNLIPSDANPDYPRGLTFTALHVRNLSNTILVLPIITGSALLHDIKNCVIALGSRQFRIHTSSNVDVYITISSNPIIEHCAAMRFAAYPAVLRRSTSMSVPTQADSAEPEASDGESYPAVQDFSHIRATPSPNWSALPHDASISDEQWPLSVGGDVTGILQDLLPSRP